MLHGTVVRTHKGAAKSTSSLPARRDGLPVDYSETLNRLAAEVRSANIRATLKVNAELINLYWSIGHIILERQSDEGWGTKVITRLSADLQREFPLMTGLSPRNMRYMRQFAAEFPDPIGQQPAAKLPWGHAMVLLDREGLHHQSSLPKPYVTFVGESLRIRPMRHRCKGQQLIFTVHWLQSVSEIRTLSELPSVSET